MSTKSLHDAKSSVQVWSLFFLISGAFGKTDHSLLLVSLSVTSLASLPFSVFDSLPLFLYHCFSLLFGFSSSFSLSVLSNQKILDFWSLLTLSFLSFCDCIYSWYLNYHLLTDNSYLILLLLWLSRISPVRLCATTKTAAYQTPPSLGFSRQEHWSGLPFPSPMHESEKWMWSCSVISDSLWPHGHQPTRLLRPWDPPGKSTGMACHCLLLSYHRFLQKQNEAKVCSLFESYSRQWQKCIGQARQGRRKSQQKADLSSWPLPQRPLVLDPSEIIWTAHKMQLRSVHPGENKNKHLFINFNPHWSRMASQELTPSHSGGFHIEASGSHQEIQGKGLGVKVIVDQSCLALCNPMDCSPQGSFCPQDSPGKNTGVGSYSLLQGIFSTQGLRRIGKPRSPTVQADSLQSEPPGKPKA